MKWQDPAPNSAAVLPRAIYRYEGCRDGVVVEFNRIDAPGASGGGHTWPGSPRRREPPPGAAPNYPSQEISASERIWEFFSQYHL